MPDVFDKLFSPVDPRGRKISWTEPYLITMAEWGIIPCSHEHELECVETIQKLARSIEMAV